MSKRNEKRKTDERIEKESNMLTAKMFWVITPLLVISLIVKLVCALPWYLYALEILLLAVGGVYVLVQELRNGILFAGRRDAALAEIHNRILTTGFLIDFYGMVVGEFILMAVLVFVVKSYFWWSLSYLLIWFVPAAVIAVSSVKKGWMVWGSQKNEQVGKKKLAGGTVIGALFYGIVMEAFNRFQHIYHDGAFHWAGLLWILIPGAVFGIFMYLYLTWMMKRAEKKADAILEATTAEQEGVVNEE